jgi:hypothetical protein
VRVTFAEVAAEMADELGGPPTLAEFLEVLSWSVPAENTLPSRFTATLVGKKPYQSESPSRVGDLDDNVFAEARELLSSVDPDALASVILEAVREGKVVLADVEPSEIATLTIEVPKKRVAKPEPGDVVAIPAAAGGYHPAVVLTKNRFGTALGLFTGTSPNGQVGRLRNNPQNPVYTDESLIKNGTWPVVDHDDSLVALFPPDPPIYHKPNAWPGMDTGEHGAAETADGTITPIPESEAQEVGLTNGTYRQTRNAAFLQKQLDEHAG